MEYEGLMWNLLVHVAHVIAVLTIKSKHCTVNQLVSLL
jgi:hypothetical protein